MPAERENNKEREWVCKGLPSLYFRLGSRDKVKGKRDKLKRLLVPFP
jgi:hypothetical protein